MKNCVLVSLLVLCLGASLLAQDAVQSMVIPMATSKFVNLPGMPACMTMSVQHGDPSKGPAVILLKATSGCVVPWHWHTANENLMMVSGTGKGEMKDSGAHTIVRGDYVYLAGKGIHQFTCIARCTLYDVTDGAFDIHYVNSSGAEITADEALKARAKPKTKTKATK